MIIDSVNQMLNPPKPADRPGGTWQQIPKFGGCQPQSGPGPHLAVCIPMKVGHSWLFVKDGSNLLDSQIAAWIEANKRLSFGQHA
jgi:hypothetical protein